MIKHFVVLVLFSLNVFSQEMQRNKNQIQENFTSEKRIESQFDLEKSKQVLKVHLEKVNDSVLAVYVQNNSNEKIQISTQDWHLYIIQEAKDEDNKWKPIEYWAYSSCGNSFSSQEIQPKAILKSISKAYNGDFNTTIRFKLLNNEDIYYSNEIKSKINRNQFILNDSVKKYSQFNSLSSVAGEETASKIIFLDPNGMREYLRKNKERLERFKMLREKKREEE